MGYYTLIIMNVQVRPELVEQFRAALEELRRTAEEAVSRGEEHWFTDYDDLQCDSAGYLFLHDYHRKWYSPDSLYHFLKDYVEGDIEEHGDEPEDIYRVVFDGKGNWETQAPVFVDHEYNTQGFYVPAIGSVTENPSFIEDALRSLVEHRLGPMLRAVDESGRLYTIDIGGVVLRPSGKKPDRELQEKATAAFVHHNLDER